MKDLNPVIRSITKEQEEAKAEGRSLIGWCSRTTRIGVEANGLTYPHAPTALDSYHLMAANPAKYGWKPVSLAKDKTPIITPCLIYFNRGILKTGPNKGKDAGHVGILAKDAKAILQVYSDATRPFTPYWKGRVLGAFIPIPDEQP